MTILLIILCFILVIMLIISLGLIKYAFHRPKQNIPVTKDSLPNHDSYKQYHEEFVEGLDWFNNTTNDVVNIVSNDGLKLQGYYFKQDNAKATIICVHGFHGYASVDFGYVGKDYYNSGFNVLIIDMRAHGYSEGKYLTFGLKEKDDVLRWVDYISKENNLPIFLDGVSMGSATVLMTSRYNNQRIHGIIADCGYTSPWDICKHCIKEWFHLPSFPIMNFANVLIKIIVGVSLKQDSPVDAVKHTNIPIIIFHGKEDTFVPTKMGYDIYDNINSEKELVIIDKASHAMSYFVDTKKCHEKVMTFINKHLD